MRIFLINGDTVKTTDEITKTTKEDLIISTLMKADKTILFEINNNCTMVLYGHIHHTELDKRELCKLFDFDEVITLQGNLYYESFNALQVLTRKYIEEII